MKMYKNILEDLKEEYEETLNISDYKAKLDYLTKHKTVFISIFFFRYIARKGII